MRTDVPVTPRELPEGYTFTFFDGSEKMMRDWLRICSNGLIGVTDSLDTFHEWLTNYPDCKPLEDTFFVTDPNGRNIATSTVIKHADGTGYVHMVANVAECRGLGIGHAMLAFGAEILLRRGCKRITLTTDDHRLAAIKTYLDGGFSPVMWHDDESDMKKRWDAVLRELSYTRPVEYIDDVE